MYILEGYEPKIFFKNFEDVSRIPHGSGNEAEIATYVENFAKKLGLYVKRDIENNIIVRKAGTFGLEFAPCVILQGHLDMVCDKNIETKHDFEKDPLKLVVEDDFICADGTTLGADNGVAIATVLTLMESSDIKHPPLEFVLTTNEEVGLLGASALSPSDLTGKYLINLDSEEEGTFYVSCAGGLTADIHLPIEYEKAEENYISCSLLVGGLKGGHSGMDINKERANANKLTGRLLYEIYKACDIRLISVNGGTKDNAIPRESNAIFSVLEEKLETVKQIIQEFEKTVKEELAISDIGVKVSFFQLGITTNKIMTDDSTKRLIMAINLIPNGVYAMSTQIDNLVETSNNLGIVCADRHEAILTNMIRSCVDSRKNAVLLNLKVVAEAIGGSLEVTCDYPTWEYDRDSSFRDKFISAYEKLYGKKPKICAIHAGLECGFFAEKIDGIKMISIGPDIFNVHSPYERLSISSVQRFWEFLITVLGTLE